MKSGEMGELIGTAVKNVAERIEDERKYLTELDSNVGDGDFGTNLHRGAQASLEAIATVDDDSPEALVRTVGRTLLEEVGGSSGVLFGMSLVEASAELADVGGGDAVIRFAERYRDELADRGDVSVGEKTMFDVVVPVVDVLRASSSDETTPAELSARAVEAARRGAAYTSVVEARKGRASYTELRSVGHPDPGAVGTYIILQELHSAIQSHTGETVAPTMADQFDEPSTQRDEPST